MIKQLCKKEIELWNRIYFFVLCCMIPLSLNIIYVMSVSDKTVIHTLMIYPYLIGLLISDGIFKKREFAS